MGECLSEKERHLHKRISQQIVTATMQTVTVTMRTVTATMRTVTVTMRTVAMTIKILMKRSISKLFVALKIQKHLQQTQNTGVKNKLVTAVYNFGQYTNSVVSMVSVLFCFVTALPPPFFAFFLNIKN